MKLNEITQLLQPQIPSKQHLYIVLCQELGFDLVTKCSLVAIKSHDITQRTGIGITTHHTQLHMHVTCTLHVRRAWEQLSLHILNPKWVTYILMACAGQIGTDR